jgi:hypothetical protein
MVWVIDQSWIFICIGIAGGIWGAVYQSRRTQIDVETRPTEASQPSEGEFWLARRGDNTLPNCFLTG